MILMTLSQMDRYYHHSNLLGNNGDFVGPHVYPQLRENRMATGDRKLILDRQKPAWFRLFTQVRTTCFDSVCPYLPSLRKLKYSVVFPAICTYLAQLVQQNLIYWEPMNKGATNLAGYCMEVALV